MTSRWGMETEMGHQGHPAMVGHWAQVGHPTEAVGVGAAAVEDVPPRHLATTGTGR